MKYLQKLLLALSLIGALQQISHAALLANGKWQVSTGGTDTNGGFFVTGSTGTDRSLTDAAFCTATDLVLVTTTTATSATCPFSAASVGNGIQVTAGTNFTVQFCSVLSVATVTATLQCVAATAGSAGATGGTFALGGKLLTVSKNLTPIATATNQTTCIKAGTYTITSSLSIPNSQNAVWIGFQTTCGDFGTKPLITSSTNSVDIFAFATGANMMLQNISISSTAGTRGNCVTNSASSSVEKLTLDHVIIDGCNIGVYGDFAVIWAFATLLIRDSEIKNSVSHGVNNSGNNAFIRSYIHDNGGSGFKMAISGTFPRISNVCIGSVFYANSIGWEHAQANGTSDEMDGCNFVSNTNQGVKITTANDIVQGSYSNLILYANGTYGLDLTAPTGNQTAGFLNIGCGANGTACLHNATAVGTVTVSGDPFVGRTSGDFALDNTTGEGAALRNAGFPGATGLFGTGYRSIGALEPQPSSGGGNSSYAQ